MGMCTAQGWLWVKSTVGMIGRPIPGYSDPPTIWRSAGVRLAKNGRSHGSFDLIDCLSKYSFYESEAARSINRDCAEATLGQEPIIFPFRPFPSTWTAQHV